MTYCFINWCYHLFHNNPQNSRFFEIIYLGRKVLDTIIKSLSSFSYSNLHIVIISNHLISEMTHRNLPSRRRLPQSHATAGRSCADSGSSRWGYPTQAQWGISKTAALTFRHPVVCCSAGVFSLATTLEGGVAGIFLLKKRWNGCCEVCRRLVFTLEMC